MDLLASTVIQLFIGQVGSKKYNYVTIVRQNPFSDFAKVPLVTTEKLVLIDDRKSFAVRLFPSGPRPASRTTSVFSPCYFFLIMAC